MGASAGKKALHRTLDSIVAKADVNKDDLALVFESYVGKQEGEIMTTAKLRRTWCSSAKRENIFL